MKSLIGQRFACLTVIEFCHTTQSGHTMWKCQCDCGKKTIVSGTNLAGGRTQSCGHLKKEWRKKFSMQGRSGKETPPRDSCGTDIDDALDELGALV